MKTAETVHREFAEAWNRRDFQAIREAYHPEYSYTGGDGKEMAGGPDVGVQIAKMYADAFPDAVLEIKRVYSQGNIAIAEMVGKGTHGGNLLGIAPTGRPVEISICNVVELRDGKVYREREYMDMFTMLSQIGAVSIPGQAQTA